jgi:transcriptional regulator with PAS, ATPase and Fis domain
MPLPLQAKLLRFVQDRELERIGGRQVIKADVRVVAATHRDLDAMIAERTFREDLLARLSGFALDLPPLAERAVDLGILVGALVPPGTVLAAAAARALFAYTWPRNVRELARVLERSVALAGGGDREIKLTHLPDEVAQASFAAPEPDADGRRAELVRLLEQHRGNVSRVAAEMGRVRQQVQRWLKRYGIDPDRYR